MRGLFINPLAVIFCPRIDEQNEWNTLVCNPVTEDLLEVNNTGYFLLKKLEENPGITKKELDNSKQIAFIDQMLRENIVYEKDL